MRKILIAAMALLLSACMTLPNGQHGLSPEGQQAMIASARIATRHFVNDSPRGAERAATIRAIAAELQAGLTADSTLAGIKSVVLAELDKQHLSDVERADWIDLLDLFDAALSGSIDPDALKAEGVVRVSEFLAVVLAALPA